MSWKSLFVCAFILGFILTATAQQSKVTFYTSPRDAKLSLDGEQIGDAHDRKVFVGFNERKGITEHMFVVSAAGYDDAEVLLEIGLPERQTVRVDLRRSLPTFKLQSGIEIDFDKVVSGIPYSTKLDATTKWKYLFHDEIPLGERTTKIDEALARMQLSSLPEDGYDELSPVSLDLIGRVDKLALRRGTAEDNFNPYSARTTATTTIAWTFTDPILRDTVFVVDNTSQYELSTALINEGFFDAVVDNFMVMFGARDSANQKLKRLDDGRIQSYLQAEEEKKKRVLAEKQARLDSIASASRLDTVPDEVAPDSTLKVAGSTLRFIMPSGSFSTEAEREAVARRATVSIDTKLGTLAGTVLSKEGYIVSAGTDLGDASAKFYNGIILDLEQVAVSEELGLTLLKVDAQGLAALALRDGSTEIKDKEELSVWLPAGMDEFEATKTTATLVGRQIKEGRRYLLTDIPAESVTIGSALIDASGRIVGVVNELGMSEVFLGMTGAVDARYIYHVFGLSYE